MSILTGHIIINNQSNFLMKHGVLIIYRRTGTYIGNHYGSGTGQIWLDDLQCTGSETSFINCTHNGWAVHSCLHTQDVSIVCGDGTLRTLLHWSVLSMQLVNINVTRKVKVTRPRVRLCKIDTE